MSLRYLLQQTCFRSPKSDVDPAGTARIRVEGHIDWSPSCTANSSDIFYTQSVGRQMLNNILQGNLHQKGIHLNSQEPALRSRLVLNLDITSKSRGNHRRTPRAQPH